MSKVEWSHNKAIYWSSEHGPIFGYHNIFIANNANSNNNSFARLGEVYPVPTAVQDQNTILAGTFFFSPDEVEVFSLDRTQ